MKTLLNSTLNGRSDRAPVSFASLWNSLLNWSYRVTARDALSSLSERQLRDIGVARDDIDAVIDREIGRYRAR